MLLYISAAIAVQLLRKRDGNLEETIAMYLEGDTGTLEESMVTEDASCSSPDNTPIPENDKVPPNTKSDDLEATRLNESIISLLAKLLTKLEDIAKSTPVKTPRYVSFL